MRPPPSDPAGVEALAGSLTQASAPRPAPPLGQQDITGARRAGAGLRAWVLETLETVV